MRGRGILSVKVTVDEVDASGVRQPKKVIINEDHQIPTDDKAMDAVDHLGMDLLVTQKEWANKLK